MEEFRELLREQRVLVASLKATSRRIKQTVRDVPIEKGRTMRVMLLLSMAEGIIAAHKAAKIDNDGYTLDLIEDVMRHVGERLAAETGDGRNFSRKRLGPH